VLIQPIAGYRSRFAPSGDAGSAGSAGRSETRLRSPAVRSSPAAHFAATGDPQLVTPGSSPGVAAAARTSKSRSAPGKNSKGAMRGVTKNRIKRDERERKQ